MRALIAYCSYSGNTKEVAELLKESLLENDVVADIHRIGADPLMNPEHYDLILIGTFTWGKGKVPDEVKDFVLQIGYKPDHVAVFGTGDTQFGGDELFCHAAVKLAQFYKSRWEVLKIEQSPRGAQEKKVKTWIEEVLKDAKSAVK